MGQYYDVADVQERGKYVSPNYGMTASKQPRFSKRLVMILDSGVRKIAVDVSDPAEYAYFYDCYVSGYWLRFWLYDYAPPQERNSDFKSGDVMMTF